MLKANSSFSFETVFSHPSKVDFLADAKNAGFKIYLYFVATENPIINQERVQIRVDLGGHDVPKDKIISRYHRTMDYLYDGTFSVFAEKKNDRMPVSPSTCLPGDVNWACPKSRSGWQKRPSAG